MELVVHPETLEHPVDLQPLAQQLQDFLRSLPQAIPFQVQCVLKQSRLLVLSEHPATTDPEPSQIFAALEQAIQVFMPTTAFGSIPPEDAKLYLRRLGQPQPYALHAFKLAAVAVEPVAQESTDGLAKAPPAIETDLGRDCVDLDELLVLEDEPATEATSSQDALDPKSDATPQTDQEERSQWLWWTIAGVGVSIVSFVAGIVIVSRPCIIGRCEPFQAAEAISRDANQTMQTAQSSQDLRQAQQKLNEANQQLSKIPLWSGQYHAAQAMRQQAQAQGSQLERILAAEARAEDAIQKGRTLPQSLAGWQGIQATWKQAIAQLETVPQETPLHTFAQLRLTTYRENLRLVDQYATAEQQAQKKLMAAKSTANVAQARQGVAQSLANWQQAQITWQVAVDALRQIPNTTTSFVEAQNLLADYGAKLAIAGDRAAREQRAQTAYQQAISLGQKATSFQRQNQWTQAVVNWRSALNQIGQISENTIPYSQAQQLVPSYTNSLQQAETQLKTAVSQQKLRTDLNQVCAGSPKTCSYFILTNSIRIQFTTAYEKALKQALTTGQAGNYGVLGGAVNNVNTLQSAFQTISNNSGLPIEVYSASGTELVGSFNPTS